MRGLLMIGVLAFAVPDRPDPTPEQAAPLKEQIQGLWQIVESTWNGGQPYPYITPGDTFEFKGDSMVLRQKKRAESTYVVKFNDARNPATFDFDAARGKTPDSYPLPGIVKIERDTLIMCYRFGAPAAKLQRPTHFATTPDSQLIMWKMKRAKK